jgi:hypothetical protein
MKKVLLLSLSLLSLCVAAQVKYDFEDGTAGGWLFSLPDRWCADNLSPLNGSWSLHHCYDNSVSGTDAAMFSINGLHPEQGTARWEFTIRHGTDPSSSNKWAFLVMSDAGPQDICGGIEYSGFVVGVNLTGYDDTLRLWHISEGRAVTVITTGVNWQNDIGVDGYAQIVLTRTGEGRWFMEVQGSGFRVQGSGYNQELHDIFYAGVVYTYTSTRDMLLWIDDVSVSGVFIADTAAPEILSVKALDQYTLQVMFSEEPDNGFAEEISLESGTGIDNVTRKSNAVYEIRLGEAIRNKVPDALIIGNLCDRTGNCRLSAEFSFIPVYAVMGDVVITEIMADPSPPVDLPECEYLELTNCTGDSLCTGGWMLIAGRDTALLPDEWIKAGERIILCSSACKTKMAQYGRVVNPASFPSLKDSGETIALRDTYGSLIHAVCYTPDFLGSGPKSGGGWSAEMTDLGNPFNEPEVWRPSSDHSGGTPGRNNSAEITTEDGSCPEVIAVWPVTPDKITVLFNETVMVSKAGVWMINGMETLPAIAADIADRSVLIRLTEQLSPGTIYDLVIAPSLTDFAGNMACVTVLRTGLSSAPFAGDIMFNELLFDPVPGCQDYIELYNNSDRITDLSALYLGNGTNAPLVPASDVHRQLLPGEYIALTTDREAVAEHYPYSEPQNICETGHLPSMPDDRGSIVLYDHAVNIIDRVDYSSSMHLIFLYGTEGIALEKVAPDLPSDMAANWHSASEACGWGTPGAENSTLINSPVERNGMQLSASRISPDSDGFEDVLSVDVFPGGDGNVITVTVFNDRGYIVRRLAERYSAGAGARFVWDGLSDSGARLPAGLYMIIAESFNTEGQTRRWKDVCALLYR